MFIWFYTLFCSGDAFYVKNVKQVPTNNKKIIFTKCGRIGNALFRYLACVLMSIKYDLEYIVEDDYPVVEEFKFYKGVDHKNDDITFINPKNINELKNYVRSTPAAKGFNTLGFVKSNIDIMNLTSNNYINKENGHGLFVKNIINIDDNNYFDIDENMISTLGICADSILSKSPYQNIRMTGYFQYDQIYTENKKEILEYIEKNKNNHFIKTATYNRDLIDNHKIFYMNEIINDMILPSNKIYDIAIHIRLGDFNGANDFIEYEYLEELFKIIDFANKTCTIVIQTPENKHDIDFLNKCLEWFTSNKINISVESNDVITDFNIMKSAKILVCSMSTLSWCAAFFSNKIETCYMPNYNFQKVDPDRKTYFKNPIKNTILYNVKTTIISDYKIMICNENITTIQKKQLNQIKQLNIPYEFIDIINEIKIYDTEHDNIKLLYNNFETYYYKNDNSKDITKKIELHSIGNI